jgi:enoyl-CoA hydratase/carnithine racemase
MQAIVNCPKPVIAEVTGTATAAGCQLVASCDLAYAEENSLFSTPGVNIGLFCSTPMVALSRNVANKHAMEMLLTGTMIDTQRAAEIGLINQTVSQQALTSLTMSVAETIAKKSTKTLAIGKQAFYQQKQLSLDEAYSFAANVMVENMLLADAEEGIGAFIEKRQPIWSDC